MYPDVHLDGALQPSSEETPLVGDHSHAPSLAQTEWRWRIITAACLLLSLVLGIALSDISLVFGYIGSIGSTTISFILPAVLYIVLHDDDRASPTYRAACTLGVVRTLSRARLTAVRCGRHGRRARRQHRQERRPVSVAHTWHPHSAVGLLRSIYGRHGADPPSGPRAAHCATSLHFLRRRSSYHRCSVSTRRPSSLRTQEGVPKDVDRVAAA